MGWVTLTTEVQDSGSSSPGVRKSQKNIQAGPEASVGLVCEILRENLYGRVGET